MTTTTTTRQIVLDTETTGLEVEAGHRIIEIGAVELINRKPTGNVFHQYICPQRAIDRGALQVHGLTAEFLADQPTFDQIVAEFLGFVADAELVIHNADFDVGFLNYELALLGEPELEHNSRCSVLDTLSLAKRLHPGQRNSLDALCKRYEIDASARDLHGALLDARLLAEVYLVMTGGQAKLLLSDEQQQRAGADTAPQRIERAGMTLTVITATEQELAAHAARLQSIDKASQENCLWLKIESTGNAGIAGSHAGQDLV